MTLKQPLVSICIPVKDFDVRPLVESLLKEIRTDKIPAEILLLEDGSCQDFINMNKLLAQTEEVSILSFETNKGRSAARNKLADEANGDFLLFLDADSLPVHPNFIRLYLNHTETNSILCGGRHYSPVYNKPDTKLHWKFGIKRELFSALGKANMSFYSNNFFIRKDLFQTIRFDESIVRYGHEDTLFGFSAKLKGIRIVAIENAVIHTSLENNEVFLQKTEDSILSLIKIIDQKTQYPDTLKKEFKIWNTYDRLCQYHLAWIISFFSLFKKRIRKTLIQCSGPLILLDIYKLILLKQEQRTSSQA